MRTVALIPFGFARTVQALLFTLVPLCSEAEEVSAPSVSSSTISSVVSLSGPFNAHLTASDGSGQIRILTPSKEMTGKPTDCTTASKIFTLPVRATVKANGDWSKLALKKENGKEDEKEPPLPPIFKLKKGSVYFSCISRAENQNVRYIIRTRVMLSGVKG